ncbi:MAG: EscU/YscU/HrcU family type III secretion system export apparatus switch protein [Hyphomonas sp.]
MSDDKDSGSKTEKPTPKRLQDARKKGDIPKSKDVTSTIGLLGWLIGGVAMSGFIVTRISSGLQSAIDSIGNPGMDVIASLGGASLTTLLLAIALLATPVIVMSILAELIQSGGMIFTLEKMKPKAETLNPVQGLKKMFSMDNLVEVVKSIVKTILILTILGVVTWILLPSIMRLPQSLSTGSVLGILGRLVFLGLSATFAVFILVSLLDSAYQKHSHTKKLRMSLRDIKQEHKETEGSPEVKQQRKQVAQEWSQNAGGLNSALALVMNPTHIAIVLQFDETENQLPWVSGKAYDDRALILRGEAEEMGVPVLENVALARDLDARCGFDDPVPSDLYEAIAEIIVWAEQERAKHADKSSSNSNPPKPPKGAL